MEMNNKNTSGIDYAKVGAEIRWNEYIREFVNKCPFVQPNATEHIGEQNIGAKSAIWGIKSDAAKEYWQRGMYSEEEVKKLCKYAMEFAQERREYAHELIEEWFEQNKKK